MAILQQILILVIGLVLLVKGADFLVDGSSGLARKLHVPEVIIGMTIIAFGTSAPELSVALQAFSSGTTDLALGDVVGCAVSNIFLLLGIAALIRPVKIHKETIKRDIPFYVAIAAIFIIMVVVAFTNGGEIPRLGGAILLLAFCVFLCWILLAAKKQLKQSKQLVKSVRASRKKKSTKTKERKTWVFVVLTIVGLIGIIAGSDLVVGSAQTIAEIVGISKKVIAMTVLALGTSLPELVTTITASRKNQQDLLVGNAVGSNLFNICIVLGLPIVIFGALNVTSLKVFDLVAMGVAAAVLPFFAKTGEKITRFEGVIMLAMFAVYYVGMFAFN